jgi:uncharacterized protein (TIGR02996 family)
VAALTDRQMLEAAIAADFEDVAAHAAYADLLVEQGDPRGEYIQLRLALENRDQSPRLLRQWEDRANHILRQHQREWLGPLAPFLLDRHRETVEPDRPNIEFTFDRGWLTEVDVLDARDAFTTVLAGAREARMLQELTLRNTLLANNRGPLEPLLTADFLPSLVSFTLGDFSAYRATADGGKVAELVRHTRRLRHLTLRATYLPAAELFALPLPELRLLAVGSLESVPWNVLGRNTSLSGLERVWLSSVFEPGADVILTQEAEVHSLTAFLTAPQFGRLTDLTLRVTNRADSVCHALVGSGVLKRLKRLDLRQCNITDEGAVALAGCRDLANLERLDIGQNRLTGTGVDALLSVGIPVQYDQQWGEYPEMPPAEDYGYV